MSRIWIVFAIFLALSAMIIGRLFFIQVVHYEEYKTEANHQYIAPSVSYFDRGSIFFTEKSGQLISAATVAKGYLLAINNKILKNPADVYEKISNIVKIDKNTFFEQVGKKNDPYEVIVRRLDKETAKKIKELKIIGVMVEMESWRYYPADNLASKVLGFVGYKGDELAGRYGIEKLYEKQLGRNNQSNFVNAFAEIFVDIKKIVFDDGGQGDVVLTIEPSVQMFVEKKLDGLVKKYKSSFAGGIVIEPKTGKILAMSAKPDFNPNNYGTNKNLSIFINPMVEGVFEMGSIMKPLTLAAAINEGKITADTTYVDDGYLILDNKRVSNFDKKGRGKVSMQEVLNQSLNTGAVFAMQKMGKDKFKEYLKNYGLGTTTGIELPDETAGKISNVLNSGSREIESANASFGQGIAVTSIEMASALSSLANGGVLMKPYIVSEIKTDIGSDTKTELKEKTRVLKKETTEEISRMLVKAFDEGLVGGKYKMSRYSIAAKTGTAQMASSKGGYEEGVYNHTFFGYGPAFDAKFLIFFFLERPQGAQYASDSLAEPFTDTMKFLLNYYEVPPDR